MYFFLDIWSWMLLQFKIPPKKKITSRQRYPVFSIARPVSKTLQCLLLSAETEELSASTATSQNGKKIRINETHSPELKSYGKTKSYNSCYNPRHSFVFPFHSYMQLARKCSIGGFYFFLRLWPKTTITQEVGWFCSPVDMCACF